MNLTVNGAVREFAEAISAAQLLDALGIDAERTAFELNGRVLARDELAATALAEGDSVEVVRFVSGG
ncbi:MAG: sulfur carrier protein ThiS [Actinobacteria bacterium]|nr:sulfur carrier protein ThiS [Actinomycetota bacterium]